ncbi:primosomal replication protein [Vibrio rumoiensis]|uniref:Prepilin peptidase n=1 Tax=Vibrio rumoiensis 1S-45 TaxID=1188252 RepID=A0A1E5E3G8_9VIBR|nr:primosomal replication protein [Vibrio rumoiensis]OEF26896.1 prepilin peptidase [Vibrio rumoiensis 1S-45]
MSKFSDLANKLEELSKQAAQRDRIKGEHHQALFDEHLFKCRSRLLVPCVSETKSTFESIIREQQADRLTQLRAEHLTQLLLSQLAAIQRELATQNIRHNEIKHSSHYRKPISELYQDLSQHQEWEIRLRDLVFQKTNQVNTCSSYERAQAQKDLLLAEQRLERCSAAKLKIEKQITFRERQNPSNDYN